jgi:capsular exopolysaccharide synthesis family protein
VAAVAIGGETEKTSEKNMSHIFDALQRSEAEREGTNLSLAESTYTVATELLEAAERKRRAASGAASERPTSVREMRVREADAVDSNLAESNLAESSVYGVSVPELRAGMESANPLDRFPTLPVSLLPESRLVAIGEEESLGAEKFRFLAVRLRQLRQNRSLKKVLITSTIPQEGKSTVAANLACTLARRKPHKTLLLEGDLRRPTVAHKFGLGRVPGLSEWLRGETESMNICRLEALGLWVLPAGSAPENPLELMQSGKLSLLMEQLTQWFDWIVIDSPPVLPLADTSLWARLADGILLVTRKSVTEKQQLLRGLEALERSKLLGALVNGSTDAAHSDYYQRYGPAASSAVSPKSNP